MSKAPIFPVIMAGGVGSRFWPSSIEERPKQFIDFLGTGDSLITMSFNRLRSVAPANQFIILTNERYQDLVLSHLPELSHEQLILEPARKNTGPCIYYAALKAFNLDSNAILTITPADQVVQKNQEYQTLIHNAINFVSANDAIVTLGIKPDHPNTGFGYIEMKEDSNGESEVVKVKAFKEKPDLETAKAYIKSGKYLWNAGLFIAKAKTIIDAFSQYQPKMVDEFKPLNEAIGTAAEKSMLLAVYPKVQSISFDFAIMELADNIYTLAADIGWSDLGTWASLYDLSEKDENQNAILGGAKQHLSDISNSIISISSGHEAIIRGLDNFIVVLDNNRLLIYPKSKEQEIKNDLGKL